jgi:hypothetical protein
MGLYHHQGPDTWSRDRELAITVELHVSGQEK